MDDFDLRVQRICALLTQRREGGNRNVDVARWLGLTWSWTAEHCARLLAQFPDGISEAVLLAELEQQWLEERAMTQRTSNCTLQQLVFESDSETLVMDKIVEARIVSAQREPGASLWQLQVADTAEDVEARSGETLDMYLHDRFSYIFDTKLLDPTTQSIRIRFTKARMARRPRRIIFPALCALLITTPDDGRLLLANYTAPSTSAEDTGLVHLKGDQVAVLHPASISPGERPSFRNCSIALQCESEQTVLVITSTARQSGISAADPTKLTPDENDTITALHYTPRLFLEDLKPNMSHVTLFGRVMAISDNVTRTTGLLGPQYAHGVRVQEPLDKNGAQGDRIVVRLQVCDDCHDEWRDITFWGPMHRVVAQLSPGQMVLLARLQTTAWRERANCFHITAKAHYDVQVYNLSALSGMLFSPCMRALTYLAALSTTRNCFARATITAHGTIDDERCFYSHAPCGQPVSDTGDGQWKCERCRAFLPSSDDANHVALAYQLTWTLDDGTHQVECSAASLASTVRRTSYLAPQCMSS
ncbi:hypothetical protein RI367_004115 [Sorochytrium milnesiophthora]